MPEQPDPARVAQIRERHYRAPWGYADKPPDAPHPCYGCGFEWPCETTVVLAALVAAEQARDTAEHASDYMAEQVDRVVRSNARLRKERDAAEQRAARLEALEQAARRWLDGIGNSYVDLFALRQAVVDLDATHEPTP